MELNDKERRKYEVIKMVVDNEVTKKDAEQLLNLSRKQINRLIKVLEVKGKEGFAHKNRGKHNHNKKDLKIIEELENLYLTEFFDYNFEAFYDEIEDKYDISYSVMYTAFVKDDIISPIAHKRTFKLYNEKMQKAIESNDLFEESEILSNKVDLFKTRKLEQEKAYIRRSNNYLVFGEEVQMDASPKIWFSNIPSSLHLAVDKATKKVLFGWFEYEELTRGYYVVLMHIILNYGIPYKIKADNRSTFSTNRKNDKNTLNTTQFGIVCNELGILLEATSVATSKANVERANKTFKDRLIAELRHENIVDIDKANEYLNNVFIPKINRKFSYDIDAENSKMQINDYSYEALNLIIAERYQRLIDNASSISFKGDYYVPIDVETGEIVSYKRKTECTVIIAYDGSYWCKIEKQYYYLHKIDKTKLNRECNLEENSTKQNQYIPPRNHSWRKDIKKHFNK